LNEKEAVVAVQQHDKHISAAVNKYATTEEAWEQCFLSSVC
jgi:hypothetical protein